MQLEAVGLTDVGMKRENNQDSILIDQELGLFIVADGMGGHKGGEVASRMAVETIRQSVAESFENEMGVDPRTLIERAYQKASSKIYAQGLADASLKGMGTTAVTALLRGNELFIGNVGDSRAYLVRPPYAWQITEDHSLVNEQVRAGLIRHEDAQRFVSKNVITRSVGFEEQVACDVIRREVQSGDHFLLCSDGLTGQVSDRRICDVFLVVGYEEVASRLIEEAKRNGGDDNISVLTLRIT
jgi:protein phosphatase